MKTINSAHSKNQRFNFVAIWVLLVFITSNLPAQTFWSDPATWGGTVPVAGEEVVIDPSMHVLLDVHTPDLGSLTIDGILEFDDNQDVSLTSEWIMLMGEMWVGSPANPFIHQATITLNAPDMNENIMGMGTRGIMVMGGRLEMHGTPPTVPWTKIDAHATVGVNTLTLMESVSWNVNDEIVLAPTDYYEAGNGTSVTEQFNLTQVNGTQLTLGANTNAFHWGLIQYATNSGMSLSNANAVTPPAASGFTPVELDQRAPVGNLSRNIVVQAPNDNLWNNNGFGCHIMVMRLGGGIPMCGLTPGCARLDGVEIRRGGQRGLLGRYPFHWHMLSSDGNDTLPDATGQYILNSSVHHSMNRGIVIHGTSGVEVSNNVIYDIRGHGIFTEDAVERRNIIDGNLVLYVRNPDPGYALKHHEAGTHFNRGSSGFWISNPDNTLINNTAADCGTNGFWLAFPTQPWGLNMNLDMNPSRIRFGTFQNNTAHSNRLEGIILDFVEVDNTGVVAPHQYMSTTDGQNPSWPFSTLRRFQLEGYKTWKNGGHGIWDRGVWADNWEIVSSDNCGRYFAGSGADGLIERTLAIGTSLNHMMNGTDRPNFTGEVPPAAFATYHSAFDIRDNIIIDFPAVANTMSGAFATNDYYIRPVEKGQIRNTNNLIVNSHPGVKLEADFPHYALAGALWDPNAVWGNTPEEWLVYDTPFFTYGQTPTVVPPGAISGGVLVDGPFFGFNEFVINEANLRWEDFMEIHVNRLDNNFNSVGSWTVDEAQPGWVFAHMRHFAAHPDDYYTLEFPTITEVNDVGISVTNMHNSSDTLIIGVEYSGNYAIDQVYTSSVWDYFAPAHTLAPTYIHKHVYTPLGSLQEVIDSPGGETYWHDIQNDIVWIKLVGGITQTWDPASFPPHSDELLYWLFYLRIWGSLALPVDLVDFSAYLNGNEVNIEWTTATEIDNEFFAVQRSSNGVSWEDIIQISGGGTNAENQYYSTIDKKPLLGISYYRLRQTDFSGKNSFSDIQTIYNTKNHQIKMVPNPANDFVQVRFAKEVLELEIEVLDSKGQSIFFKRENAILHLEMDFSSFEAGLYFVKVKTDGRMEVLKLVKR